MAGIGKGLAAFAQGYLRGMAMSRQMERDDLEMAKLRDERAMAEEFKNLDQPVEVSEGYVLSSPDGTHTVFADEQAANDAKNALGGEASVQAKFLVAGQPYDTREQANAVAEQANSPAAKLRQRAEIALKYNRPDIADAYTRNYNNMIEANRRDMQERFIRAQQTCDYGAVLDVMNQRLAASGGHAELVPNAQGGMTYQVTRNGQVVTQRPFASPDEFWSATAQQMAMSPDNMLEVWKTQEGLRRDDRDYALRARKTDADIANDAARLGLQAQGLALDHKRFGLQQREFEAGQARGWGHRPFSGLDEDGNVAVSGGYWTPGPNGQPQFNVTPVTPLPGLRPQTRQDPFSALLGGASQGGGFSFDGSSVPAKGAPAPAPAPTQRGVPLDTPAQTEAKMRAWQEEQTRRALEAQVGR